MSRLGRRSPLVAVVVATLLSGCASPTTDDGRLSPSTAVTASSTTSASVDLPTVSPTASTTSSFDVPATEALLAALPVKGRAPMTGYDRALFGQAWSDDVDVEGGHNGCDTRNDILRRDLTDLVIKPNTNGCVALSGTLFDEYTGDTVPFLRGQTTSDDVQIDHVVALADAWQKGAQQLTIERRRDLANDPVNLQAVEGPVNQSKGSGDAATWLPPEKSYRCTYVARQITVKSTYGLWVTQAEHDAMAGVLAECPG